MADLQETVGAVIRRARRERGLTLRDLAERSAISVVYLGEIERGKKYPSSIVLERLADALELTTPDLLELVADEIRVMRQPQRLRRISLALPTRRNTPQSSAAHSFSIQLPEPEMVVMVGSLLLPRGVGTTMAMVGDGLRR